MSDNKNSNENIEELFQIQESSNKFIKKRLILWVIRWVIGFSIIGVVVHYNENLAWLWWVGIGFALITPILSFFTQKYVNKKLMETHEKIQHLDDAINKENT